MKITVLTSGSRRGMQAFISLSLDLIAKDNIIKLADPFLFKDLVEEHGTRNVPLAGEREELSRRFNDVGNRSLRVIYVMLEYAIEIDTDVLRPTEEACQDDDPFIHSLTCD